MVKKAKSDHRRVTLEGDANVINDLLERARLSGKVIVVADAYVHIHQLRPQQFINYFQIYDRLTITVNGYEMAGIRTDEQIRLAIADTDTGFHIVSMTLAELQKCMRPGMYWFLQAILKAKKSEYVKSYAGAVHLMNDWDWRKDLTEQD